MYEKVTMKSIKNIVLDAYIWVYIWVFNSIKLSFDKFTHVFCKYIFFYLPTMSLRSHAEFAEEVVRRSAVADANARREYVAARRIQSVWRGHHMRQYIKKLHRSAAIVQRCYRGYRARRYYFQVLEQAVQTQTEQFYGRRAVLIQKTYRGFASRRNVFDYYRLKAWLKQIVCKGAELEEETWNYFFDERNRKLEEVCLMFSALPTI